MSPADKLPEVPVRSLRIDNGVEIAAVRDIHRQRSQVRALHLEAGRMKKRRDIDDADAFHVDAVHGVVGVHAAGRDLQPEQSRGPRTNQAVFDHDRDGPDRPVSAHREAAAGLDEEEADVRVGSRGRVENAPGHHVVAARLEHEPGPDPVVLLQEVEPALVHGRSFEAGTSACDHPDGVPAGVGVDAEEGVCGHGVLVIRRGWRSCFARGRYGCT